MRNRNLETPLFIASYNGHTEVVKTLLEHGAEATLHVLNCHNISPLWAASFNGSSEIVKELLYHGAGKTITTPGLGDETPLHAAATENHAEVLKLLLEVPAVPVNQKTTYGFTPLFIASRNGYHDMVELLLSVDSIEKYSESWLGLNPLFAAVANGHLQVTKLLISKGAHLQPSVSIGRDLLWWAQRSNKLDLIQLLKTQEALAGTAGDSCEPLPGPFASFEPLSLNAKTIDCTPGFSWCYVCTLSVRNDQEFHCVECSDSYMYLCSECFSRGFQLCPRPHTLISYESDESDRSSSADGSVDS
ncbi:ankyrin repeat-containing domain protein [Fusarium oxysporum]|nr:ankyrin repeat-containing domain protein [Fusarium oxysporum]